MYDGVLRTYFYKKKVLLHIFRTRVVNLSQNINILLFLSGIIKAFGLTLVMYICMLFRVFNE